MKFKKRVLFLALLLCLLIAFGAGSALAAEGDTVTMRATQVEDDIYKLTVSVDANTSLYLLSTVLSYDSSVIVPVNADGFADFTPEDEAASSTTNSPQDVYDGPVAILAEQSDGNSYESRMQWLVRDDRSAFLCVVHATDSPGAVTEVYEFYFRLAEGKGWGDVDASTLWLETVKTDGSFLSTLFTTEDSLGNAAAVKLYADADGEAAVFNGDPDTDTLDVVLSYDNSNLLAAPTVALASGGLADGGLVVTITDDLNPPYLVDGYQVQLEDANSIPFTTGILQPGDNKVGLNDVFTAADMAEAAALTPSTAYYATLVTVIDVNGDKAYFSGGEPAPSATASEALGFLLGDIDGDGLRDINDITAMIAHILRQTQLTGTALLAANCDRSLDGVIDINDLTALIAHVLRQQSLD